MESVAQLIKLIGERLDPDEFVDVLGYSTSHLCTLLRREIIDNRDKFEEFLDVYDTEDFMANMFEGETDELDSHN